MNAEVGALRVAVGADITDLIQGMGRAQQVVGNAAATMSKSAKASARVFEEGFKSADRLKASVDPLFAAQQRYNKSLAEAERLSKAGFLDASALADVQTKLKLRLDEATIAFGGVGKGAGNSRIAMLEMQHVARGAADQFAAGTPISQIFAQHLGQVAQAGSFAQGSLGKFGAFLGGPWGIALTLATVVLAKLAFGHKDAEKSVDDLLEKMRDQASQAEKEKEAHEIWARSIDGVREAQEKLRDELDKSLKVEAADQLSALDAAQNNLAQFRNQLPSAERERDAALRERPKVAAQLQNPDLDPAAAAELVGRLQQIDARIAKAKKDVADLKSSIANTEGIVADRQIQVGEAEGKALADLGDKATRWGDIYTAALRTIEQQNPKAAASATVLNESFEELRKAIEHAASAGVDFEAKNNSFTKSAATLGNQLKAGKIQPEEYAAAMKKLADQLERVAKAADEAKKATKTDPVSQFKQRIIGAEGTGPNKAGSPAAGIGQFMPDTWLSYFNKLFPDKADLSEAAKLAFRNVRTVAEGVIDKATDDYKAVLAKAGQNLTAANLYTVHVLGAPDAAKFFAAKPTDSARSALGGNAHADRIVAQNGTIFKGSVAEAQAALAKRIGDSSSAVSSAAVSIENALAKGLEDEAKKRQRFFDDEQQQFAQILDLRKQQGLSAAEVADVEHQAVEQSRLKLEADILAKQAAGDYTKDEADLRIQVNNNLAKLRDQTIERVKAQAEYAERERQIENTSRVASGMVAAQSELLKAREGLVTTAKGRRAIEERLLELQFEEEKRQLEAQIQEAARLRALADRTKATQDIAAAERAEADAKIAQARLPTLPERQEIAQQQNAQANANPLQQWAAEVPKTADEINAALQSIEVEGLNGLTDALTGVLMGTKSLKEGFHELAASILADLIKMTIKMMLFKALESAIGGISGGFGGGVSSGGSSFISDSGFSFSGVQGFATGGSFTVGGVPGIDKNTLSLNGLPIANVSHGERIDISNDNSEAGSMGRPLVLQTFDLNGAVVTSELLRQMDEKSQMAAEAGAKMGVERMIDLNSRTYGKALGAK